MPKPSSLRPIENGTKYEMTGDNGVVHKIDPTITKDGNHFIIIKGTGLEAWGIKDEKIFPKQGDISGTAIAIAVLDKEHNLVGIALGRGDTGANNILGGSNGSVTFGNILHNDGTISELDKGSRIKIGIDRSGNKTKVNPKDAEELNKVIIMDGARDPSIKKITAEIEGLPKLQVAEASEVRSQNVGGGQGRGSKERS